MLGLVSPSIIDKLLPLTFISGTIGQLYESPEIVHPLPPLPIDKTKLVRAAKPAQYFNGKALPKFLLV